MKKYIQKWFDPLVIVTITLAFATYWLFREAVKQGKLTEKTLKEAIHSDSISEQNLVLAKKQFYFIDSVNKLNFEIEHRPFLTTVNLNIDSNFVDNRISITSQIRNTGKLPAKISTLMYKIKCGKDTSHLVFTTVGWVSYPTKGEISGNAFYDGYTGLTINPETIQDVKKGNINVYFYVYLKYSSVDLKRNYSNYSVWKITSIDKHFDYLIIQNK
ncbi:MAG TPA: hypothetical protein VIJ95_02635 [Hanamia sp.]